MVFPKVSCRLDMKQTHGRQIMGIKLNLLEGAGTGSMAAEESETLMCFSTKISKVSL